MEINLDENDIINEVSKNHKNNATLFFKIIDESTSNWDSIREVTEKLLDLLIANDELSNLLEKFETK